MVLKFSEVKSVPKVLIKSLTRSGLTQFRESIAIPRVRNLTHLNYKELPMSVFIMNLVATSIISIGVLASVYAGYITPEYRLTAGQMSGIINGLSTILMFIFIDPYMSALTDDVMVGKITDSFFRRHVVFMVFARVLGTLIAQLLFVPSAQFIAWLAVKFF
jgi:fluoride ion exporter CrcB/FEX